MKLPNPSGFSRTSPTARICEHLENSGKASLTAPPPDLRLIFDLPKFRRVVAIPPPPLAESIFTPIWKGETMEKAIFLPLKVNGHPVLNKNGKPETFRVDIVTCAVTVTLAKGSFTLTATSRGTAILDSRDGSRKLLAFHRAELARLFPDHEDIAAMLGGVLRGPAKVKPRKVTPLSAEDATAASAKIAAREETEKAARKYRYKKVEKPVTDFAAMTPRQFAAFNRKATTASAERGMALASVRAGSFVSLA
jgi:hypothetical protein